MKLTRVILITVAIIVSLGFSLAANASIYPQTVERVASIGDRHAVDRIEAYLWGYGVAAHVGGCKSDKDANFRREAEKAWLEIKYNADRKARFIDELTRYFVNNYECVESEK